VACPKDDADEFSLLNDTLKFFGLKILKNPLTPKSLQQL
jgi:hypothetical protein